MAQSCIYIKASEHCIVYDKNITLGDVLNIECTDIGMLRAVKQMDLYAYNHEHSVVFSVLKVIERIHRDYPMVEVINYGVPEFVVEYQKSTVKSVWIEKIKLILISVIVFFGSAFTIMTFHNDVGVLDVFETFYEQLMGEPKPKITELEISYSIGLAVGIVVFFNHFSKRKITSDPTPIEVEMKKYNEDLIKTKIAESDKKGHTVDVS